MAIYEARTNNLDRKRHLSAAMPFRIGNTSLGELERRRGNRVRTCQQEREE